MGRVFGTASAPALPFQHMMKVTNASYYSSHFSLDKALHTGTGPAATPLYGWLLRVNEMGDACYSAQNRAPSLTQISERLWRISCLVSTYGSTSESDSIE